MEEQKWENVPRTNLTPHQFTKITGKFTNLLRKNTYHFALPHLNSEIELVQYSFNQYCHNWQDILLCNGTLYKNLRATTIFINQTDIPILTSTPISFEYPSPYWSLSNPLVSFETAEIKTALTQKARLVCYGTTLNDSRRLLISYSARIDAWVVLYGGHKAALITSNGTRIYSGDKPSKSTGFKTVINMWKQTLARWKATKILPVAETELEGYTLMFECIGTKHEPSIFAKEGKDDYILIRVIYNHISKESKVVYPLIDHEEFIRIGSMFGLRRKKWVNLCKHLEEPKDILEVFKEYVSKNQTEDITHTLITVENKDTKTVLIFDTVLSLHYMMCKAIKEILKSNLADIEKKTVTNDIIDKALESRYEKLINFIKQEDIDVKYYYDLANKCLERLTGSLPGKELFQENFPRFLKSTIEFFTSRDTKEVVTDRPKAEILGYHLLFFAPNTLFTESLMSLIIEKYKFHIYNTLEELNSKEGNKGFVYYIKTLPVTIDLLEYVKTHRCRAILYGATIEGMRVHPGISIIPQGDTSDILNAITMGMKILRTSDEIREKQEAQARLGEGNQNAEEQKVVESVIKEEVEKNSIVLIMFLGLPGMGKSSVINKITDLNSKLNYTTNIISSDLIKETCINEYKELHPDESEDNILSKTLSKSKQIFNSQLSIFHSNKYRRNIS